MYGYASEKFALIKGIIQFNYVSIRSGGSRASNKVSQIICIQKEIACCYLLIIFYNVGGLVVYM